MGVFPCALPCVEMGNLSVSGVRSLLSVWDSVSRFPNSLRRLLHHEPKVKAEEEGKEGTRALNIAPRNFYKNQCRVLEEQLSFAEEISCQNTSRDDTGLVSSANLLWPQSALTELRRVLKVGKTLIEECNDEPCLKAYLRQGERTRALAETLKEIVWCMSVVFYYNSIKGCLSENPNSMAKDQFPFVKLGAYKELHMLQKAALADQTELLTSLDIWIQDHVCSANECGGHPQDEGKNPPLCIAAQILGRRAAVGTAAIEDSCEVDHTSVLWNINSKVLKNSAFIGGGGFCSVVETKWLGDTYAKKIFQMESPEVFRNEANALSKLSHRHMVTVLAYCVDSHTCSLLMERKPYDLRQYMTYRSTLGINPPFSIPAAVDLMLQVAETMRYMHSQGMVHRDLKPANILVEAVVEAVDEPELHMEGFVVAKLTDFGLAKSKREVTAYSHMTKDQGTRRWMAPEMFGADADNDEHLSVAYPFKADVYSFGIVCFEVLTGMIPFPDVRLRELYSLITDADKPLRPELPKSCPESLASLIRKCWHTDPERRPPFTEICTMLRYLKAHLMLTDTEHRLENVHLEPLETSPKKGDGQLQHPRERPDQVGGINGTQIPFGFTGPISRGAQGLERRWGIKSKINYYKSSNSDSHRPRLLTTTFDGSSWTSAVLLPEDMHIDNEMSFAEHRGALVAIHWRRTDSLSSNRYTGSSWTQPELICDHATISGASSESRPAVASFKGHLFSLQRDGDNYIRCTISHGLNGRTQTTYFGCSARTAKRPALAAFGDRLISVIRGLDNRIYWSYTSDPIDSGWSVYAPIDADSTTGLGRGAAELVVLNNELYCFVRAMKNSVSVWFWSRISQSDTTWSRPFSRIEDVNSHLPFCRPSNFTVFGDQLVYTSILGGALFGYGTVFISESPPVILSMGNATNVPFQYHHCRRVLSLCVIGSKLFCIFEGVPRMQA